MNTEIEKMTVTQFAKLVGMYEYLGEHKAVPEKYVYVVNYKGFMVPFKRVENCVFLVRNDSGKIMKCFSDVAKAVDYVMTQCPGWGPQQKPSLSFGVNIYGEPFVLEGLFDSYSIDPIELAD